MWSGESNEKKKEVGLEESQCEVSVRHSREGVK